MGNLNSISLEFREGSSDKVYKAAVLASGGGYVVDFAYGRRGSTLATGTKTSSPVTLAEANKVYEKLVQSKVAKGYKPTGEGGGLGSSVTTEVTASVANAVIDRDQRDSGLYPQLLVAISEDDAERYLTDDRWGGQEKFDGKRMTIRKADEVTASNKKGLTIGFPDPINECFKSFASHFVTDGESIGDRLYAFDLLELNGDDLRTCPYADRLEYLTRMLASPKFPVGRVVQVAETAIGTAAKRAMWNRLKAAGKEGMVFKLMDAQWSAGRPETGGPALKCKFYKTASVIVLKVNAKRSVAMGVLDGETIVPVGNVTIGPNKEIPSVNSLIEVRYLYAYKGGSLYQPTYLQDRSDELDKNDCSIRQLVYKAEQEK